MSVQHTLTSFLLNQPKPGEVLAKLKMPFKNYSLNLVNFEQNPQFRAVLHRGHRVHNHSKIKTVSLNLGQLKQLYHKYKDEKCQYALCCLLAVVLVARSKPLLEQSFKINEFKANDNTFWEVSFPTKTTPHKVIVAERVKCLLEDFLACVNKLTYKRLLDFTKTHFDCGSHICRSSGAEIMSSLGSFTDSQIKHYGNWHQKCTLSTFYLKTENLKKSAVFWNDLIGTLD